MTTPLELATEFAERHHCPSIVWGIVHDGALADTGAIGGVDEHTVFRIASMTKSFSAAATLLLRDDGVLRLDDAIADHAPELGVLTVGDELPITVRDALTMTSGLPTDDPWADRHLDLTDDEFDQIVAEGPLRAHATGDAWEYSNFGFALLGRVVHRATGRRLQQIVTDRLLTPLGMTATTWTRPDHENWARPTRWLDGANQAEPEPLGDGLIAPMGGLWSTVTDLATWVSWLDDAFPARNGDDDGPLRRASRRSMQQAQRSIGLRSVRGVRSPTGYGFGLQVAREHELGTVVSHSGGLPGYGSNMRWLPGRKVGVVAMANVTYAPMAEFTARVLDELAHLGGVPVESVPISAELADIAPRLVELINDWDDETALQLFTRSLLLDDPIDRRRAATAELVTQHGRLTTDAVVPSSQTRAIIRCTTESGAAVTVDVLLAPPRPARIQQYSVTVANDAR